MKAYMDSRHLINLIFSCVFLLACTPLSATKASDTTPAPSHAKQQTDATDTSTKQWEKERAAYERDLDYSTINSIGEYKTKRTLVETKYYLSLAYMDLNYNRDKSIAVKDIDRALSWLKSSMTTASPQDMDALKSIQTNLQAMRLSAHRDAEAAIIWLPEEQQAAYESLIADLERLIQKK